MIAATTRKAPDFSPFTAPESRSESVNHDPTVAAAVSAVIEAQSQLAEVLKLLSDNDYTRRPIGVITSSIGGHVRHCLDHVQAILSSVTTGAVNYDHRERDKKIENSRNAAIEKIGRQNQQLKALAVRRYWPRVRLLTEPTVTTARLELPTCLARELTFVLSHTIHHCALIRIAIETLGQPVPEHFGYAPSTVAYLKGKPCAR